MCELPDLVLENLLAYLDLRTLIRCRAVSKRWCALASGIRVRNLLFSDWDVDHLHNKWQLLEPDFDRNYIECSKFESFFRHYAHSLLSRMRHLRVCELDLSIFRRRSAFVKVVNGFGELECLDLVRVSHLPGYFELNLPNLRSVRFEELKTFGLTLDTPRLSELTCLFVVNIGLDFIHPESVESLLVYGCSPLDPDLDLEKLKNLRFIYIQRMNVSEIGPNFLVNLVRLEEIHLNYDRGALEKLQLQRHQYNRTDLRIYFHGLCLDHLNDYEEFWSDSELGTPALDCTIANPSKLAARLPLNRYICYSQIKPVVAQVPVDYWTRFSNLEKISVYEPVEDVQQFLSFLRNFDNVHSLQLDAKCAQSLFDQLPKHCPRIQKILMIGSKPTLGLFFSSWLQASAELPVQGSSRRPVRSQGIRRAEVSLELRFLSPWSDDLNPPPETQSPIAAENRYPAD